MYTCIFGISSDDLKSRKYRFEISHTIRLLILTSQTCRARDAVINLSLEKTTGSNLATWEQPFYISLSLPLSYHLALAHRHSYVVAFSSLTPRVLFEFPFCYGPEDFVNASMHMYFIASSFGRSLFGSTRATITENARQGYFCRIDSFWKYLKLGRFVVCARVELDKTPVSIASHSTDLGSGARLKDSRGSAIDAGARIVEKVKGRKRGSKGKRERNCGERKDRVRGTKIERARARRIKDGGTVMAENLIT